jgi:L-rhamnonate dehydratase
MGQQLLVEIETNEGLIGTGAVIPLPARSLIEDHLSNLLIGEDPFAVEVLWDQMYRATLPYGRKGLALMAISAVDVALWDVIGKATGLPLWRLLGGRIQTTLPTYATGNDVSANRAAGYQAFKLLMPFGPSDGARGMKLNLRLVEDARDAAGPDAELMLDCFMAWNVDYTIRMAHLLEPCAVRWIEDCLPPDDYDGYAELVRRLDPVAIATGEHEATRWGFKELLARGCRILQPDVSWAGGITETRRIFALASAFGAEVIPHNGGMQPWALHLMIGQANCSAAEIVVLGSPTESDPCGSLYPVLAGGPSIVDGRIGPSELPGVGVAVNPDYLL